MKRLISYALAGFVLSIASFLSVSFVFGVVAQNQKPLLVVINGVTYASPDYPLHELEITREKLREIGEDERASIRVSLRDNQFTSPEYQKDLEKKRAEIKKIQTRVLDSLPEGSFKPKHMLKTVNGFSGVATKQAMAKLLEHPDVASVQRDAIFQLALAQSRPLINGNDAEYHGYDGSAPPGGTATVCVIDSGIDYTHTNLGGCTQAQFLAGTCAKVVGGIDTFNNDNNPMDDMGHGTHVAGIVASNHSTYRGIAPNARLAAVKVCNDGTPLPGGGTCPNADIEAGLDWCRDNAGTFGINVTTMSLGGGGPYTSSSCPSTFNSAIANLINANIPVIAASGNNGFAAGIMYPACAPSVISVGATYDANLGAQIWNPCTDLTTQVDQIICFTNRASNLDVLAPGCQITSTTSSQGTICGAPNANGFGNCCGTSMATPHVAGIVALLKQQDSTLTPAQIESILENGGERIVDNDPGNSGISSGLTFPRVDAISHFVCGIV